MYSQTPRDSPHRIDRIGFRSGIGPLDYESRHQVLDTKTLPFHKHVNVLFLTSETEISGIIYSLFRDRQNIFLTIFCTKSVVK